MDTDEAAPAEAAGSIRIGDVCTLPGDAREQRMAFVREQLLPRARARRRSARGVAWTFPVEAGLRDALETWVEAERRCCGGLGFALHDVVEDGEAALVVEVRGPEPALRAALGELAPAPSRRAGLLRAAAAGLAGGLLVCCLLPAAAIGLLGGAFAGRLAGLEDPLALAAVALIVAGAFRAWERRRAQRRADPCGC